MVRRWCISVKRSDRSGETHSLSDFLPAERRRIMDGASKVRREQMRAAEASRDVYRAWNEVCSGTREAAHVTGLHYVPESNELIVYADGATWVSELSMMREIIRARMFRHGVDIADIKVKRSREGFERRFAQPPSSKKPRAEQKPSAMPLSPAAERALDEDVSPIDDPRLRQALKNAMKASFENTIPTDGLNKA